MILVAPVNTLQQVALLTEGVDRNESMLDAAIAAQEVALLTEGVDRNNLAAYKANNPDVALLTEGVDRNTPSRWRRTAADGRPPHGGRG